MCIRDSYKKMAEKLGVGEMTLRDIVKELTKPGRDPREEMPKPVLRTDVLDMKEDVYKRQLVLLGLGLTGGFVVQSLRIRSLKKPY